MKKSIIIQLLRNETAYCYKIGTWLKFTTSQLDAIKTQSADHADAMGRIITSWLKGNYNTEMFGPPTWKMLVEAVGASSGGNNKALANKIAKDHPRAPQTSPVSCSHAVRKVTVYDNNYDHLSFCLYVGY